MRGSAAPGQIIKGKGWLGFGLCKQPCVEQAALPSLKETIHIYSHISEKPKRTLVREDSEQHMRTSEFILIVRINQGVKKRL